MTGLKCVLQLHTLFTLLVGTNCVAGSSVPFITGKCRDFLETNPPGIPCEFIQFSDGSDLVRFFSADGEYTLFNVIKLHQMGDAYEDEEHTSLCMSFVDTSTYTFDKGRAGRSDPKAWVTLHTQLDVLTSIVNVSTACWKRLRNVQDCFPTFIPMPGIMETPLYVHSPLKEGFWTNFQDEHMFSTNWIWFINFWSAGLSFPSHWVSNLQISSLKTLEIKGNSWVRPEKIISFLPNLDALDLTNNNIEELPNDIFNNTPLLTYVILAQNNISKFPSGIEYLERISLVDLTNPKGNAKLSISDSEIRTLVKVNILGLEHTRLEANVSKLLYLPSLQFLNLSGCSISEIREENVNSFNGRSQLLALDISLNSLTALPKHIFAQLRALNRLIVHHNSISECPHEAFRFLRNLERLDLSANKMIRLQSRCFARLTKLEYLSLSHNQLESLDDGAFDNLVSLQYLLLAHNKISTLSNTIFADIENPIEIDLSSNRLEREPVLGPWNLDILHLSNNSLTELTNMTNYEILSINWLDLSYNAIRELNILKVNDLNLSYNTLTHFSNNTLRHLARIRSVDLGGNNFSCCHDSTPALKHFVANSESEVLNLNTRNPLTCFLTTLNQRVPMNELSYKDEACMEPDLTTSLALQIGIPVAVLCVLFIAFVTAMHFYRFELTYINHLFRMKKRGKERHAAMYSVCTYDAFVCYSGKDFLWVTQQLLPKLEEGSDGYRLCLHDRDFALGTAIDTNIIVSLEKSRKVIIVLTQDFIASRWCQWELEMANHRTFEQNRAYIILIELERLDRSTMPRHLRFLMETRTYLEWPQHGSEGRKVERAWQRLREALGESILQRTGKSLPANCSVLDIGNNKV